MWSYRIGNLIPCRDGDYHGHLFTREVNATVVRNTNLPIPVVAGEERNTPAGSCTALWQEADGSVSAAAELSWELGGERFGIGAFHSEDEARDYLDYLFVTQRPDPCGDKQFIECVRR